MKHTLLIIALLGLASCPVSAHVIDASQVVSGDRWFEVELIIFQRQHDHSLIEQFNPDDELLPPRRYFDLLQPYYQPNITALLHQLALCPSPALVSSVDAHHTTAEVHADRPANHRQHDTTTAPQQTDQPLAMHHVIPLFRPNIPDELCIFEPQPKSWLRALFDTPHWIADVPLPDTLVRQPSGITGHQAVPYLLSRDALQFNSIVQQLQQQADIEVLLHSGFRQAPVTERRSIASRWYAGHNLQARHGSQPAAPLTETTEQSLHDDTLLQRIEQRYQQWNEGDIIRLSSVPKGKRKDSSDHGNELSSPQWQLDGFVRVHLDHYLFVNTDFIVRQPVQDDAIHQHRIQFSRRVISGEMHYIDHPHLGMVLQIRRYTPPEEDTERSNYSQ